ncbi:MAG: CHAT domain-containing protein, partial [Xanthomonadaceae bacterium]|nr:CHAT domain-containing protein [Xanthomonadaceae bacterium]
ALNMLERALAGHRHADDAFAEIETLRRIGQVHSLRGDATVHRQREASVNARAIARAQSMGSTALPALRRAGFLASMRDLYDRQIDLWLLLDQPKRAWRVAGSARMAGLRELTRVRARNRQDTQRQVLLDQRAATVSRLHAATTNASQLGDRDRLHVRRQLDRIGTALQTLEATESAPNEVPDLEPIQQRLGPGRLLLSYYRRADGVLLWVVDAQTVRIERIVDDTLDEAVAELLGRLRNPRNAPGRIDRLTRHLGQLLLGPAREPLALAEEILIEADDVLHSLPFALLSPAPGIVPPLIEHRHVRHVLSATPLQLDSGESRLDRQSSMLVLADPGWRSGQPDAAVYPRQSLLNRLLRDSSLASLPGARREAEAIAELTDGAAHVRFSLGPNATRESVLAGGFSGYRLLHLATHGLVDLDYPELSSLLLASANGAGPAFLRPHEIAELDIDAELVVLSGCETGLGKTFAGSGAFSLARPFLIAGAEQVLASLWKVDDHRTALFMQRFYQHLLTESRTPAQALARAQRWMRRQPATTHPYYWAGFVLTSAGLSGPDPSATVARVQTDGL